MAHRRGRRPPGGLAPLDRGPADVPRDLLAVATLDPDGKCGGDLPLLNHRGGTPFASTRRNVYVQGKRSRPLCPLYRPPELPRGPAQDFPLLGLPPEKAVRPIRPAKAGRTPSITSRPLPQREPPPFGRLLALR